MGDYGVKFMPGQYSIEPPAFSSDAKPIYLTPGVDLKFMTIKHRIVGAFQSL